MDDRLRALTKDMAYRPGASEESITALRRTMQTAFPADYVEFMRTTNGAEGLVGSHYLVLLPVEEIATHNEELQVSEFAPGLVLFADNGAGTAYAFDTLSVGLPIVNVPYVGLRREDARQIAPTFTGFLESLGED